MHHRKCAEMFTLSPLFGSLLMCIVKAKVLQVHFVHTFATISYYKKTQGFNWTALLYERENI